MAVAGCDAAPERRLPEVGISMQPESSGITPACHFCERGDRLIGVEDGYSTTKRVYCRPCRRKTTGVNINISWARIAEGKTIMKASLRILTITVSVVLAYAAESSAVPVEVDNEAGIAAVWTIRNGGDAVIHALGTDGSLYVMTRPNR